MANNPIDDLAQRFSIPPPLVSALQGVVPPSGLLASYGLDENTQTDPNASLAVLAHAFAQAFAQHGSVEQALSHVLSGSPHGSESPTSPINGQVMGIMGRAATLAPNGLQNFRPSQPQTFGKIAEDFGKFLKETADLGGIVSHEQLQAWNHSVATIAPPPKPATPVRVGAGALHTAPTPKGPGPAEVEEFASQMKGLGIDVNHFMQNFPMLSALRYKMLSTHTSLQDYAPVNGLSSAEILDHVRNQPHPTYPHLTAGQYADAKDMATLHSRETQRRDPAPAEIAKLAASKAGWNDVRQFYLGRATNASS